jgi:chromosome condensin MukBEF ATPase and DNA-binding subunit MukB
MKENDRLTARVASLEHRLSAAQAENERLREELEDSNGSYRDVMKEACAGGVTYETDDRLHCTCVPHLREGVKALTARTRDLEAERTLAVKARDNWREAHDQVQARTRALEAALRLVLKHAVGLDPRVDHLARAALTEPTPPSSPREESHGTH